MADKIDIVLAMLNNQWTQAQQSEKQRAFTTNIVLVLYTGLQSLIVQRGFDQSSLPLAMAIIVLGLWGVVSTEKYYERFRLHVCRVGRWMDLLERMEPSTELSNTEKSADALHGRRHPKMLRLRLNWLWFWLHVLVVTAGVANLIAMFAIDQSL